MKRFAPAALTLTTLGLGMIDGRPAAAVPGGYGSAPEYIEVQYRPAHRQVRRYYRQERRAERRQAYHRGRY